MKKIGVIFPGMGYHSDKPLLYYGKKMMIAKGYDITDINYGTLPKNRIEAFNKVWDSVCTALSKIRWEDYDKIIFLSKSIGSVAAAKICSEQNIPAFNIYNTPVPETIPNMTKNGIVNHGTKDPLMDTSVLEAGCREKDIPLYKYENGNHSIETDDIVRNVEILEDIVRRYDEII